MSINFEKYALTGNKFVKQLAKELGDESDISKAGRVLRSTLHVLREQSTPEESMQFISQLPMFIKAIYVDGWAPSKKGGRVRQLDKFILAVRKKGNSFGNDDFTDNKQCHMAIQSVFKVIKEYVSDGEIEDLRKTLPEGLKSLLV